MAASVWASRMSRVSDSPLCPAASQGPMRTFLSCLLHVSSPFAIREWICVRKNAASAPLCWLAYERRSARRLKRCMST
eukprot:5016165-Lingulodinium_polyedra.AAC.1